GALRNTDRRSRAGAGGPRQAHRGRCLFAAGSIGDRRVAGPRQRVADGRPCRARPVRNARAARSAALWKRGRIVHRCVDAAGCITLRRRALARAQVDGGQAGPFQLWSATAEWRSTGEGGMHAAGQVTSRMEEAMAWLQAHPGLDEYAPRVQSIGLQGKARLNFNITVPAEGNPKARVDCSLQGARLNWASGAEPIEDLTGSLAFDGGRLQGSTLTGTWLGGPVTLRLDERPDHGQTALVMQARGSMAAQQLAALAAIDPRGRLAGSAEWAGDLTFSPATAAQPA